MRKLISFAATAFLVGCASSAEDITASYVSPIQYQSHSCTQLTAELQSVNHRLLDATRAQDQKSQTDALVTGVGVVLFWPALFLIDGDGQNAAELARLKGEFDAIEKAAIQKNCSVQEEIKEARAAQEQYRVERAKAHSTE